MITINAAFGQEEKVLGTLGRIGENETRQIVFDCSDILTEYPGAEIVCVMQRHCDRIAYLADAVLAGNVLTVTLTDADVSASGDLRIELRALTDGKIRKSAVYMGQVVSSLRGEQDKPGNPTADVLNRIDMTISRAEESIAEADAAAKSAQTVADIVQAKLDNGDFVGAKGDKGDTGAQGPQGEKGADGKDAVVDATLTQSGQAADAKVTGDAFGQLKDEKADKKDIPAPYTLPTASADVKGGVKVGEGLQMDGDVLGVKPEAKYELIETIQLEGDMVINRTQEPDGTPYNFTDLLVEYELSGNSTTTGHIYTSLYSDEYVVCSYGTGNAIAVGAKRFAAVGCSIVKGAAGTFATDPGYTSTSLTTLKRQPFTFMPNGNITRIYASASVDYPEGSIMVIKGVRA